MEFEEWNMFGLPEFEYVTKILEVVINTTHVWVCSVDVSRAALNFAQWKDFIFTAWDFMKQKHSEETGQKLRTE